MFVNKKKSIRLKNRTKYFIPGKDRTYVNFSSPESYQSRSIKQEGYETRLYWQYRYCEEHSGQSFFYTLTYNDASIPQYHLGSKSFNCFDYNDLRDFLTGGFRKKLLRQYGTTFKYFIGAELGDGKGERGLHNNPHYHILFFLEPANSEDYSYRPIDPKEFRHLVRLYWQGVDQGDGFVDYRTFKYGVAREGENLGKVLDFRACMYCAKYVCKDVKLKQSETDVKRYLSFKYRKKYMFDEDFHKKFFKEYLYPTYNVPMNAKHTKWLFDDDELCTHILGDTSLTGFSYYTKVQEIVKVKEESLTYDKWFNEFIDEKVQEGLSEFRNRHCNKFRISQGVGDYALSHIDDKLNPTIQVPDKKGFKNRPLSMYYYRKLFTDVVKDSYGSNIRVLNSLGIQYKVSKLPEQLKKKQDVAYAQFQSIISNERLFNLMRQSDINTVVGFSFTEFQYMTNQLLKYNTIQNIIKRYAEYKMVYEDRFFENHSLGVGEYSNFPLIDVAGDYRRFLVPSIFSVSRNDGELDYFLESTQEGYLPYYSHPYFCRYLRLFDVLDLCSDYFFVQKDDRKQKEAEEIAQTRRFHNQLKMKEFYRGFGL